MNQPCLPGIFLRELEVPHTGWYTHERFEGMTFKSLFGLSKLLGEYGIETQGLRVADKAADLQRLTPPFLAQCGSTFAVVEDVEPDGAVTVEYGDGSGRLRLAPAQFRNKWTGVVLLAFPDERSGEPDYRSHHFTEVGNRAKKWVLVAAVVLIGVYLFVTGGLWRNVSTVLLTLIDLAGIYITYHLVLKSLGIESEAADSICGVIDRNGCHSVLSTSAAKFFGIFGWSEVGLSYFAVSLGCLLVFPEYTGYLALINACACPFSFWSVWYQKYRAQAWCTLCLITQACLWLSLGCYIFGGWFGRIHTIFDIHLLILGASYVAALLGLNALMPAMDRNKS